jgi:hypothetical protein
MANQETQIHELALLIHQLGQGNTSDYTKNEIKKLHDSLSKSNQLPTPQHIIEIVDKELSPTGPGAAGFIAGIKRDTAKGIFAYIKLTFSPEDLIKKIKIDCEVYLKHIGNEESMFDSGSIIAKRAYVNEILKIINTQDSPAAKITQIHKKLSDDQAKLNESYAKPSEDATLTQERAKLLAHRHPHLVPLRDFINQLLNYLNSALSFKTHTNNTSYLNWKPTVEKTSHFQSVISSLTELSHIKTSKLT